MRRTWMLLFVIALLAIFMAVPAMAATGHDHNDGTWTDLTAGQTITAAGNYSVPVGFDGSVTVNCAETIVICLNGNDWNCAGKTTRPLTIQGGANVTLCDCSETPATLTGGTVAASGASININASTLTITDITVTGGRATDDTLDNSTDPSGGNIAGSGTGVHLYLGVQGSEEGAPTISNGYCEENGGNIYCGNVTIYNASVIGGEAGNAGGNIQASTLLTMYDGLISDGVTRRQSNGELGTSGFAITAYNTFNTPITMSGGTIKGGVHGQKAINISGTATIEDAGNNKAGLNFSGDSGTLNINETNGAFTGKIVFYNGTSNNRKITTNLTTERMEALMAAGKLVLNSTSKVLHSEYTTNSSGVISAKYIYVRPALWYCKCGYTKTSEDKPDYSSHNNGGHASWCDKVDIPWIELSDASLDTSGNYYLTGDITYGQQVVGAAGSAMTINLDLNGHSWIRTSAGRLCRFFGKGSTLSITDTSNEQDGLMQATYSAVHGNQGSMFWLSTDRTENKSEMCATMNIYAGSLVVDGYGGACGVFGNNSGYNKDEGGHRTFEVNMYGGSIDAPDSSGKHGAVTVLAEGQTFNMFGGTISNAKASNGGAIRVSGGTFNMSGGTISNSAADNGGAVYMNGGAVNMTGGTITGCTANSNGGAISVGGGTFSMSGDAKIEKSNANNGGAVYVGSGGTVSVTGGTITGGTANVGGAICVIGGSVTVDNATINGGTATYGGAVYVYNGGKFTLGANASVVGGTATSTNTNGFGGGAIFVRGSEEAADGYGTVVDLAGSVSGGTAANAYGGNIYLRDYAILNINGATITGGTSNGVGGNIYATNCAKVNIDGATITNSVKGAGLYAAGIHGFTMKGNVTMSGNDVADIAFVKHSNEANSVALGDTFAAANPIKVLPQLYSSGGYTFYNSRPFTTAAADEATATAQKEYFEPAEEGAEIVVGDDNKLVYQYKQDFVDAHPIAIGTERKTLAEISTATDGDYVTLLADVTTNIELPATVFLNLNGKTITGNITVADGETLKLADASAVNYEVGTGAVTGTITGDVARTFTTGGKMGGNYRFLVMAETTTTGEGEEAVTTTTYTSHRIYLAVRSTVLVPYLEEDTYIKYRTYFKCDEAVAAKVTDYGAKVTNVTTGAASDLSYVTVNNYEVKAEDLNNLTIGMNKIFADGKSENVYSAMAYITLNDNFAEGNETVTSAASTERTLKGLVETADSKWAELSASQQSAMKAMWDKFSSYMTEWTLEKSHYEN